MPASHHDRPGAAAEEAVAAFLVSKGYRLLERNLRIGSLEIDLVCLDGRTVVVVEVRSRGRSAWTSAFGSIGALKRARVRRAGERLWQRRFRDDPTVDRLRYDAVSAWRDDDGDWRIEHAPASF